MIIDQLANAGFYQGLGPRIAAGLRFLTETDCRALAPGRHAIDGDSVYALVQEYQTRPRAAGIWEAHRRYIDIQFVADGAEIMGYAPVSNLAVQQVYDIEKDFELFGGPAPGIGEFFRAPTGAFAIFAPPDAHMPGLADGAPAAVRKVVVKVNI